MSCPATGADTLDALVGKAKIAIPKLLAANGVLPSDHKGDILLAIVAGRHERALDTA